MAKKSAAMANRRAEAAAAVAAAKRREQRSRWLFTWICVGLVVVIGVALAVVIAMTGSGTRSGNASIPSRPRTTAAGSTAVPPWPAPADPAVRVAAAGLPMLSSEGSVEHIHAHLDVLVNGQKVAVPAGIGVDQTAQQISPVHTHDGTGVVHVESPTKADFSLGQVFTEWNVALSADQLGGLTAGGDKVLRAYVNGKPYTGNPAGIILGAHDEIALVYGTTAQQANPPASYTFEQGE